MNQTQTPDIRLAIDARVLTPAEDTRAREMSLLFAAMVARDSYGGKNFKELFEPLMLAPYAFMYALQQSIEGAREAVPRAPAELRPELERFLKGLTPREEPNGPQ